MFLHITLVAGLGLAPVLLFLTGLLYLDSFKLVGFGTVVGIILLGSLTAVASYFIAGPLMDALHLSFSQYSRYAAPVLEECLKALVILYLVARNRIGFMIDAAILGVAVGAGFAVVENIYYGFIFPDANLGVWVVRGFGTAIMHGGATAIFGVTAQNLSERHARFNPLDYIPGLIVAISLHSIFNQFTHWPLFSTAATILVLPMVLLFVFDKSEHEAHDWLVHDYESHEHLLEAIQNGTFADSEGGRLIVSLAARLGKEDVADIFAYLSLHTQLVLEAERRLLARESGAGKSPLTGDREKFARLHALERKIGKAAMLIIWPHLKFTHKELWELHRLEVSARRHKTA